MNQEPRSIVRLNADGTPRAPDPPLVDARMAVRRRVTPQPLVQIEEDDQRAQDTIDASIPENTRRAYEFELHCFASWCTRRGLAAMPADPRTLRIYMRELADSGRDERDLPPQKKQKRAVKVGGLGFGTVMRALGAICTAHVRAEQPSPWNHPKVEAMRNALARLKGVRPTKKKALEPPLLTRLMREIPNTAIGLRDRALILLGWHAARRRSEVVVAHVEHFERSRKGMIWLIPKSKTDQESRGHEVPISFADDESCCAILALDAWLAHSGIVEGAVFRAVDRFGKISDSGLKGGETVSLRVKHYAEAAGLDPKIFAGHSLRSGWMTTAARAGVSHHDIKRVSGHKSDRMVDEYIQHANALENAPGKGLI